MAKFMHVKNSICAGALFAVFFSTGTLCAQVRTDFPSKDAPATGPLRVHTQNPRYFTDGTILPNGSPRVVYLTGSHTWPNLIDRGPADPPPRFDFERYLDLLEEQNHNFIRLWTRHAAWYHEYGEQILHAAPLPWSRTGPGEALDGKPRFDLTKLHEPYFQRLRKRVAAAQARGIYVSAMLFGGQYECQGGWKGNPFHSANNINGVDGDPKGEGNGLRSHTLEIPTINQIQERYIKKVLDTLTDFDNVLYEISNEGHRSSFEWQRHWVAFIHRYERAKPKQHPVGLTALYIENREENQRLLRASAADWISPLTDAATVVQIPPAHPGQPSLLDSDHWFVKEIYNNPAFGRDWVWKAFCRGHQPILMEHLPPLSFVDPDYPLSLDDAGYAASRKAMGHTRAFSKKLSLGRMAPVADLSSTKFCLASEGEEYLVYQPEQGQPFSLKVKAGRYFFEWFDVVSGQTTRTGEVECSNAAHLFTPSSGEAVVYLKADGKTVQK